MTIRFLMIIGAFLFSIGAQAAEQAVTTPPPDAGSAEQSQLKTVPNVIHSLLQYALSYEGAAYRRGGTSPQAGFDCSGFVRYVFDHVEGVVLPHSAQALSQIGNHIKMAELHPGDLVFFRLMRHGISHVGIYLGNNQFIHASSTRTGSVMVSDLSDNYWARHFTLARRLGVPDAQLPDLTAQSETPKL